LVPIFQAAARLLRDMRHFVGRYLEAVSWLERKFPLHDATRVTLVTLTTSPPGRGRPGGGGGLETVVVADPAWGAAVDLPREWDPALQQVGLGF
jgi:hypothetical protein